MGKDIEAFERDSVLWVRKELMQLSPKAVRFLIEALEHYQTHHEERLQNVHVIEDEAADLANDYQYLEALKTDLQQYHDGLMCKAVSPPKVR